MLGFWWGSCFGLETHIPVLLSLGEEAAGLHIISQGGECKGAEAHAAFFASAQKGSQSRRGRGGSVWPKAIFIVDACKP